MKPQELMIGNWVRLKNNPETESTVLLISDTSVWLQGNATNNGFDDIDGIPLTEQWLQDCGFLFDGSHYTDTNDVKLKMFVWQSENGFKWTLNRFYAIEIPYVHTLQNLYYAINGKELKAKS